MDLAQIVEALIFAAPEAVTAKEVAHTLRKTAKKSLKVLEEEAKDAEEAAEEAEEVEEAPPKKKAPAKKKAKKNGEVEPADLLKISSKQISEIIEEINEIYNATGRPMHLVEGPGGWRFYTRLEYAPYIRNLMPDVKPERFSGPAMETLAIIAYRQPITKADIEAVRGVSVDGVLNKVIDRGLVKIGGRANLPGRPLLYETSETFLEHFGIKNIEDLPNSGELRRVELPSAVPEEESANDTEGEEKQLSLGANSDDPAGEEEVADPAIASDNETVAEPEEQAEGPPEGASEVESEGAGEVGLEGEQDLVKQEEEQE